MLVIPVCNLCQASVPWYVDAKSITIKQNGKVVYEEPILYLLDYQTIKLPFFFHYLPGSPAANGFLIPSINRSSTLGTGVSLPFYWKWDQYNDFTVTNSFFTNSNPIISFELRNKKDSLGNLFVEITKIRTEDRQYVDNTYRWQMKLNKLFSFRSGKLGLDINTVSDYNYLAKYHSLNDNYLASSIYWRYSKPKHNFLLQYNLIENLLKKDISAVHLPVINYKYQNDNLFFNSNFMSLDSLEQKYQRLSNLLVANLEHRTKNGLLITLKPKIRNDIHYSKDKVSLVANNKIAFTPSLNFDFSYPMIKESNDISTIMISPLLSGYVATSDGYFSNKYQEQNIRANFYEFLHDSDVVNPNYLRHGQSVNYGVKAILNRKKGFTQEFMMMLYHFKNQQYGDIKLPNKFLSLKGSIYNNSKNNGLDYKLIFNQDREQLEYSKISYNFRLSNSHAGISYIRNKLDVLKTDLLRLKINHALDNKWTLYGSMSYNFSDDYNTRVIEKEIGVIYEQDCWGAELHFGNKPIPNNTGISKDNIIGFKLYIRNIQI